MSSEVDRVYTLKTAVVEVPETRILCGNLKN